MEKDNQENDYLEYNINSWDDLDIDEAILRGIHSMGFENPSPIQQRAIKPISMGRDIVAQAQSGTGKTATFAIGALSRIDATLKKTQVIYTSALKNRDSTLTNIFQNVHLIHDRNN